jgi:hypothetical protein
MNGEDPVKKCDGCKILKPKSAFNRSKQCKRCHNKNYIGYHLLMARLANRLNVSIKELNNILNGLGEHERYDEAMLLMTGHNMPKSTKITDDIINEFLDE